MIREHAFNSTWWGGKAGVSEDPELFAQPLPLIRKTLGEWEWVEFRADANSGLPLTAMRDAGFVYVDTQIHFRVALRGDQSSCEETLLAVPGSTGWPVEPADLALFGHERFRHLPGMTPSRLNERYALWASRLRTESPDHCFEFRSCSGAEGWYFASPDKGGAVGLTLGVQHRDARISGYVLYAAALRHLASMGYRFGWASFSAANTPVHNIYAQLGARFVRSTGVWLWIREAAAA